MIELPRIRRFSRSLFVASLAMSATCFAADPEVVRLWPGDAPGSEGKTGEESVRITDGGDHVISGVHRPTLTVYLPSDGASGAAVVVVPGGGHRNLWSTHEGHNVARWLADRGVAGFVLKHRLAREEGSTYTIEGESLDDAKRSIRLIRSRAEEWAVDPARIGIMGFSAGGEIAALAATIHDPGQLAATDPIERHGSRPAFVGLIYPAIPKDMKLTADMPLSFLVCGENDRENISRGLPELYMKMKQAGASAELHVYAGVGHGFGMRDRLTGPVSGWLDRFYDWMDASGFLGE